MPKKYLSKIQKNGQVLYIKDAEARDSKQDKIDDLASIRSGAALGATAVQTETDPTVPAWAKASTKPTYTASEVGLGNVGNFKAVSTVASQGLSTTEKTNARNNIGAGTSSFSGSYTDLTNKPTIPNYSAGTNISISNNTINAKGLPVGSGTVTTLSNLPVTNRLVVATISTNQSTVSISNGVTSLTAGCELHVIIKASAAVTVTLPTSNPYINMSSDTTLSIDANGYAEINFVSDGTKIYVRSIA